jgi:hypothetical protein
VRHSSKTANIVILSQKETYNIGSNQIVGIKYSISKIKP